MHELHPNKFVDSYVILPFTYTKFLDVTIDDSLTFKQHVSNRGRTFCSGISALLKVRSVFPCSLLIIFHYAFIHSHINYCI